jgi:hypothetical protein
MLDRVGDKFVHDESQGHGLGRAQQDWICFNPNWRAFRQHRGLQIRAQLLQQRGEVHHLHAVGRMQLAICQSHRVDAGDGLIELTPRVRIAH